MHDEAETQAEKSESELTSVVTRSKSPPALTIDRRSSSLMNCWYRLPSLARRAYDWPSVRSDVGRV